MPQFPPFEWPHHEIPSCPFPRSQHLSGIRFLGRASDYHVGDTWYPSWASDGNLYSPWTDGEFKEENPMNCDSWMRTGEPLRFTAKMLPPPSYPKQCFTGQATMVGNDPLSLSLINLGITEGKVSTNYPGRYPCGTLVHNGIWYYGTYALGPDGWFDHEGHPFNWPVLGPFLGFRLSRDYGKTWEDSPHSLDSPLFPEPSQVHGPIRIGAPHFVDFGRNMEHSPDGKAYLVAHGSTRISPPARYAHNSWITSDHVYLIRVSPSPETINDPSAWEFYAGTDANGQPLWTSTFTEMRPLLEWEDHMGCVTVTWIPGLQKFLMCVTNGRMTNLEMDSYFLEADAITGPWKMVTYLRDFGVQAYFLNLPSKFVSDDGRRMWLCYSGNFAIDELGDRFKEVPPGSKYGLVLQEIEWANSP